jgi:branched-chain amino acid transport system permease protein
MTLAVDTSVGGSPRLAAIVRTQRPAAIRLALLSAASIVGYVLSWVKIGDDLYGRSSVDDLEAAVGESQPLLTWFATVGWIVIVAAVAVSVLAFLRSDRRLLVSAAVLYLVLLLWHIFGYERLVDGRDGISPSTGWVLMLIGFGFSAIGTITAAVQGSRRASHAVESISKPLISTTQRREFEPAAVVLLMVVALLVIPARLDAFWVANFTQMALASVLAASTGMLYGRVGMVSLGQVAPYGIGTWVTMRLSFATDLPFPLLLLIGGAVAALLGMLIGLPALRVSGLYLALVTLMMAATVELVLGQIKFPNGGPGFTGVVDNLGDIAAVRRPSFAESDVAYYRFVVVVAFLLFMLAAFVLSRRAGRAWASIQRSEAAALSSGIQITQFKLWAFVLASFMAGMAGGLYAGSIPKGMAIDAFNRQAAIFLIAGVIMGGIHSLWGGVLAGFFTTCLLKFLTQNVLGHDFWTRFALTLFGIGLITNLVQSTKAMEKKGLL